MAFIDTMELRSQSKHSRKRRDQAKRRINRRLDEFLARMDNHRADVIDPSFDTFDATELPASWPRSAIDC